MFNLIIAYYSMSNLTNGLIETITIGDNNLYILVHFKQSLYSNANQTEHLTVDNFLLYMSNGQATLKNNIPELIFKDNDTYVILFSLNGSPSGQEQINIDMINIYNKGGFLIDKNQRGNYVQLNKQYTPHKPIQKKVRSSIVPKYVQPFYHYQNSVRSTPVYQKKEISPLPKNYSVNDYLRDYEDNKNKKKIVLTNKYNQHKTTCHSNMTYIQSNPGLAYKLNLIKYNAYVASKYSTFYGNIPSKYPPQYFMSSYNRIFKPQVEISPFT